MGNILLATIILTRTRIALCGCGAEDSTLKIEKKCGEPYTIKMTYDSTERELLMYIPSTLCDQDEFKDHINKKLDNKDNPFDPSLNHIITLPMMIAIHCFGCMADNEMSKWKSFAEEFTFILIAPQGIESSWNADECCGQAKEEHVDDIGFIQTIINGAQTSFSGIFPYATVSNKNWDGYVWITGFSNGGFMSDKIVTYFIIFSFAKYISLHFLSHNTHYCRHGSRA